MIDRWGTLVAGTMLRLEVLAGGDRLRVVRLTQELHGVLAADDGVTAAGLTVSAAPQAAPLPAARGTIEAIVALLVAGAPYARSAADALSTSVQSWCARDRRLTVKIQDDDRTVEMVGSPTPAQRELVEKLWRDGEDDDRS